MRVDCFCATLSRFVNDTSVTCSDRIRTLSDRQTNQVLEKLATTSYIMQQLSEKYLPDDELIRSKRALEVSVIKSDNIAHQQSTSTTRSFTFKAGPES
jgi:hypothetical protein